MANHSDLRARILIVDDDRELSFIIKKMLENYSYNVSVTHSCDEAFELLTGNRFDLVLLDVNLPDGTGFDICRELRRACDVPELLVRVNALLRRTFKNNAEEKLVCFGDTAVNITSRTVEKNGRQVSLSLREFDLLSYLCEHPNTPVPKEKIFSEVWGAFTEVEPSTLAVHIRWLREKLEDDPADPKYIKTVRKVGYMLEVKG